MTKIIELNKSYMMTVSCLSSWNASCCHNYRGQRWKMSRSRKQGPVSIITTKKHKDHKFQHVQFVASYCLLDSLHERRTNIGKQSWVIDTCKLRYIWGLTLDGPSTYSVAHMNMWTKPRPATSWSSLIFFWWFASSASLTSHLMVRWCYSKLPGWIEPSDVTIIWSWPSCGHG